MKKTDVKTTAKCISIKIPCYSEYVGVVRLAVSGLATRMNFSIEDIEDIKIAVSEACTNSVQYAYAEKENKYIDILCNSYKDKLELIVSDTGKGFDLNTVTNSRKVIEKDKLGLGLGITFMKSLMDKTDIISTIGQGTTIKMIKKLSVPRK
jgi:serine/threonine-protein kinase RsbW